MPSYARLAVVAAIAVVAVVLLVDAVPLAYAVPVSLVLAWLLPKIRWTDLARLRVVQGAVVGHGLAVVAAVAAWPWPVTAAGLGLVALAAAVTGYGLVRFRR